MANVEMVATCLFGLEKMLGEEIDALGCRRLATMDGRVTFEGSLRDLARANIFLRLAERVYLKIGSFPAQTFDELFEGTRALPWDAWIGAHDAFPVSGHAIRSRLYSVPDCQSIVKKAIVSRLSQTYGLSWFPEDGVTFPVELFLFKDEATLMIDTSGVALHKRGYRPAALAAPLRETLAAAIARTAHIREGLTVWDPFCGSGTIAIESAMILEGRAPGRGRSFLGETFPFLPAPLWADARTEADDAVNPRADFSVFASDIDENAVTLTRENARRAGVEGRLRIFRADARKIERPDTRGSILCNPPYGERLMTPEEVRVLVREIGQNFASFAPWQIYILSALPDFERAYGRRADKSRALVNGRIPCRLYEYFKPRN